jgi:hypothetical protein
MCFSAEASFASGAVLSAIGVASVKKVSKPEQRLFAVIPLLFAAQQFAEGVLWTTLRSGGHERLQNAAMYIFLITALVIWPVMVPLSVWFMEKVKGRRKLLAGLVVMGGAVSLIYVYYLISHTVTVQISGFHLAYYVNGFPNIRYAFIFYLLPTVAPLFVSSVRRMWLFGILIAASCAVTGLFYAEYLTSVWCFFAALISVTIYWVLVESRSKVGSLATEIQR